MRYCITLAMKISSVPAISLGTSWSGVTLWKPVGKETQVSRIRQEFLLERQPSMRLWCKYSWLPLCLVRISWLKRCSVLSAIALLATIGWIFLGRHQHNGTGTAAPTTQPPPPDPESGFPMSTTQHPGTVVPGPGSQQQGQYLTGQGQPQPQPPVTSSLVQPPPPQPQPQLPVYDQIAPQGFHPQAQYEVPQQPKY